MVIRGASARRLSLGTADQGDKGWFKVLAYRVGLLETTAAPRV